MLNTGQPDNILNFFKMSDVDPRELIMLFKDLYEELRSSLSEHCKLQTKHKYLSEYYDTKTRVQGDPNFANFNKEEAHR